MSDDLKTVLEECGAGSEEGRLSFPQTLAALAAVGVEGYLADLRRATKIYYLPDGTSFEIPAVRHAGPIAGNFDAASVAGAVRQSQAGTHSYKAFCEKIMASGCAGYLVSLSGRRVVYFGRTAETHVEHFPAL